MLPSIMDAVNTLVHFCARRDVPALTDEHLGGRVDVAILFGGSTLAGGDMFAEAMRADLAEVYLIVGGQGHSTDALRGQFWELLDWRDTDEQSEARLFDGYLRERYGLTVDLLEEVSTNCGNNVTNALALLDARGIRRDSILFIQDATMQQRMDAGFRKHVAPSTRLINFASHQTLVHQAGDQLVYSQPPPGIWRLPRYVSMLMGEIPRLTDDEHGYGPAGAGYIAHVDVPTDVTAALDVLRATPQYQPRTADKRWAG